LGIAPSNSDGIKVDQEPAVASLQHIGSGVKKVVTKKNTSVS